jgi:transcriptional regulator of heat shock response
VREHNDSFSAEPTTSLQTAHREQTESSTANRLVVTTEQLERIREQARNDSRTLVAGQVNALSQKNNNLRAQLNEALRKLGQLENQCKAQASNGEMRPADTRAAQES